MGILEIDKSNSSLIINFNINAEVVDGNGKVLKSKSEDKQKIVPLDVDGDTDVEELAEHLVSTQKYIPAQKLPRVIKLLTELQEYIIKKNRRMSKHGKSSKKDKKHSSKKSSRSKSSSRSKDKVRVAIDRWICLGVDSCGSRGQLWEGGSLRRSCALRFDSTANHGNLTDHLFAVLRCQSMLPYRQEKDAADAEAKDGEGEEADPAKAAALQVSMDELDDYLDHLYNDDFKVKALGVRKVLQLAQNDPTNLEALIENEPLIGALSRVLQDDYKQSIELTLPLCTLFCIFSKYSDMHFVLLGKATGSMAVKIIELELARYSMRASKMKDYQKAVEAGKKDQAFLEAEQVKTREWLQKQEQLLFMCIRMLLNLSEDVDVERKMAQKTDLMKHLVTLLSRKNPELLKVVLVFVKKLSIVLENSIKLTQLGVVKEVMAYIPCKDPYVAYNSLKLLFNLSFNPTVRKQLAELDAVKNISSFLPNTRSRPVAVKILYVFAVVKHTCLI